MARSRTRAAGSGAGEASENGAKRASGPTRYVVQRRIVAMGEGAPPYDVWADIAVATATSGQAAIRAVVAQIGKGQSADPNVTLDPKGWEAAALEGDFRAFPARSDTRLTVEIDTTPQIRYKTVEATVTV